MNILTIGRDNRVRKETKENRENSEAAQRERYYATIHKVSHQAGEKIPEGKLNYRFSYFIKKKMLVKLNRIGVSVRVLLNFTRIINSFFFHKINVFNCVSWNLIRTRRYIAICNIPAI